MQQIAFTLTKDHLNGIGTSGLHLTVDTLYKSFFIKSLPIFQKAIFLPAMLLFGEIFLVLNSQVNVKQKEVKA